MKSLYDFIAVFAPRTAARLMVSREYYDHLSTKASERKYEAAAHNRLTKGWQASFGSADREIIWDLLTMRNRSHDLVRNNPYASSAIRQLTANLVGPGIRGRAQHKNKALAKKAQAAWDRFVKENRFGAKQKLAVRAMIEGGDAVLFWRAKNGVPDSQVDVLEGEYIDHTQNGDIDGGGRRVMGVEYDANGERIAFAMYKNHPGDVLGSLFSNDFGFPTLIGNNVVRVPAEFVDLLYEELRPGQTRGVPWFAPSTNKLRELGDLADAIRTKKKVEACLAVFRKPGVDDDTKAIGAKSGDTKNEEVLRPGMIVTGAPGEEIQVVNPSSSGDSDTFYRNEMMAVAASMALPYHLLTGDVSQANYSSLRAATVAFWAALDDWQENVIYPKICDPAFARVMRREALTTGDKRYLEVLAAWTPPGRAWVDPLKDAMAELAEVRAGIDDFQEACSRRGVDWRERLEQIATVNAELDRLGLALDIDPRRVNSAGALQPPAGYLFKPQADAAASAAA